MAPPKDLLDRARRRARIDIADDHGDRAGLIALTREVFPHSDIGERAYIDWQYDANPDGKAVVRLALASGTVVGQYAVIPRSYSIDGKRVLGCLSLNTMTHPQHRGKGIFMVLAEEVYAACAKEGMQFTLGFPNPSSYPGFVRHLNFAALGELPLWLFPFDLRRIAAGKFPGSNVLGAGAQFLWKGYAAGLRAFDRPSDWHVEEVQDVDHSFDELWSAARGDYACLGERSARYIRWRFRDHPTRKYRLTAVRSPKGLLGYLVTRMALVNGISCGMIVDLFVRRDAAGKKVARALLLDAMENFSSHQIHLAGALMPRKTPGADALSSLGFLRCPRRFVPQPFSVILRWHASPDSRAAALSRWYLTMGDYDAI